CVPVEAPEGTAARPLAPFSSTTSTSTVGFPRLSRISRPMISTIAVMVPRGSPLLAGGGIGWGCRACRRSQPVRKTMHSALRGKTSPPFEQIYRFRCSRASPVDRCDYLQHRDELEFFAPGERLVEKIGKKPDGLLKSVRAARDEPCLRHAFDQFCIETECGARLLLDGRDRLTGRIAWDARHEHHQDQCGVARIVYGA